MNWFAIALIGAIGIAIHQFSITKLIKLGLPLHYINAVVYSFASIVLIILYKLTKHNHVDLKHNHILWISIAIISVLITIIATLEALKRSINPGYVGAILSTSAILLTILSICFFNSPITVLKGIGITLALAGAILLGL
ncbi:hypothetical protein DID74_02355 [Candidatus Marinamargulisbacteria bacterium SCGC AG-333-B06]|nr:hypothetical protein DID74_02355 [Candidatus Marinamargulisbacteria bacterium SCGC AG-333-B06]